ncbi:MAG TPA: DUF302 domain-containing protein [Longimicrobiales bacterium]|nr:DUF302 domain-containing protein [Longimicrobiales bacterium]
MSIGTYGIGREVNVAFDEAERRIRKTLADEGFGVLTEIDVQATLHKKLDVEIPRYTILGACNPHFAHQAILAEPDIGLLLPCNVVVREAGPGRTVIEALDPVVQLELTRNPAIEPLAAEVRQRLTRAVELAAGAA